MFRSWMAVEHGIITHCTLLLQHMYLETRTSYLWSYQLPHWSRASMAPETPTNPIRTSLPGLHTGSTDASDVAATTIKSSDMDQASKIHSWFLCQGMSDITPPHFIILSLKVINAAFHVIEEEQTLLS